MRKLKRIFNCSHGSWDLEIDYDIAGEQLAIYSIKSAPSLESWLIDEREVIEQFIRYCKESEGKDEP